MFYFIKCFLVLRFFTFIIRIYSKGLRLKGLKLKKV